MIVIGSSDLFTPFDKSHPEPESELIAAIRQKRFPKAIQMLDEGANPNDFYLDLSNAPCAIGRWSALELAMQANQKLLVEALFQHGAHPNASKEVRLLTEAALFEKEDMLRILLAHGIPIDVKEEDLSRTALMNLVEMQTTLRGVTRLLDAGADVNASDQNGMTALMFAALNKDLSLVRLLLTRGADPARQTRDGVSALSLATEHNDFEIVTLLKQDGVQK